MGTVKNVATERGLIEIIVNRTDWGRFRLVGYDLKVGGHPGRLTVLATIRSYAIEGGLTGTIVDRTGRRRFWPAGSGVAIGRRPGRPSVWAVVRRPEMLNVWADRRYIMRSSV